MSESGLSGKIIIIMKIKYSLLLVAVGVLGGGNAGAAVLYGGGNYTQDFNSLNGVSSWANDSTLVGWFARTTNTTSITAIGTNTGSTTAAGLYSFGVAGTNVVGERSLGFATTNAFTGTAGSSFNYIGLNLTNSTSNTMTTMTIAYDGEQWRRADNTAAHKLTVEYSFNATSLTTGTWNSAGSALTFTAPQVASTAATLDGNAASNSSRSITATISSLSWTAGSGLWIRFVDPNDSGNDHVLTIDNFSFTAVPEPGAALLGGLGMLAFLRRRR